MNAHPHPGPMPTGRGPAPARATRTHTPRRRSSPRHQAPPALGHPPASKQVTATRKPKVPALTGTRPQRLTPARVYTCTRVHVTHGVTSLVVAPPSGRPT